MARTIDLGEYRRPHGIAFLPDNRTVAVSSETSGLVLLVDATTGQITGIRPTFGQLSHMVVVARDGRRAFTANMRSGDISAIDLASGEPKTLPVSTQTEAIGVAPDAGQVWVGSNDQGTVTVVRTAEWRVVDTLRLGSQPYRIVFSPDGRRVLVTTPQTDEVDGREPTSRSAAGAKSRSSTWKSGRWSDSSRSERDPTESRSQGVLVPNSRSLNRSL